MQSLRFVICLSGCVLVGETNLVRREHERNKHKKHIKLPSLKSSIELFRENKWMRERKGKLFTSLCSFAVAFSSFDLALSPHALVLQRHPVQLVHAELSVYPSFSSSSSLFLSAISHPISFSWDFPSVFYHFDCYLNEFASPAVDKEFASYSICYTMSLMWSRMVKWLLLSSNCCWSTWCYY